MGRYAAVVRVRGQTGVAADAFRRIVCDALVNFTSQWSTPVRLSFARDRYAAQSGWR